MRVRTCESYSESTYNACELRAAAVAPQDRSRVGDRRPRGMSDHATPRICAVEYPLDDARGDIRSRGDSATPGWQSIKRLTRVASSNSSIVQQSPGRAVIAPVPRAASPVARTAGDVSRASAEESESISLSRRAAQARSHNDVELAVTLEEESSSGRR